MNYFLYNHDSLVEWIIVKYETVKKKKPEITGVWATEQSIIKNKNRLILKKETTNRYIIYEGRRKTQSSFWRVHVSLWM